MLLYFHVFHTQMYISCLWKKMIADFAEAKAHLEQEKSNFVGSKVVPDAVKQAVFKESVKSFEFKQLRQSMASKVGAQIHADIREKFPEIDLSFMEEKYNLDPEAPRQQLKLPRRMLLHKQ